jgi:uncharacterized membrane protein HdeD (DUF308 family)
MPNEDTTKARERLEAGATRAMTGLETRVGSLSSAIMIKAVLFGILGVCALVWPTASLRFLVLVIAALLIADGVAGLVGALRANERGGYFGQSILSLVIGLILLVWPGVTMSLLLRLAGLWAILHGAALLWSLRQIPSGDPLRSTQRIAGIVLAVIGAVLLFWPTAGAVTLGWVIGIGALIIAAALFWLARRMKGFGERMSARVV